HVSNQARAPQIAFRPLGESFFTATDSIIEHDALGDNQTGIATSDFPGNPASLNLAIGRVSALASESLIVSAELGSPRIRIYQFFESPGQVSDNYFDFLAYDDSFGGGVRVAVGDVDGDGIDEIITAPGPSLGLRPPAIKVFSLAGID